ncbi:MAG TPA: flotillin-like protein FloA [Vicinamibacteria bacterium]|nr:flotillin-like protein FloA [Vicinamibacteria bacterium]HXV65169.1 flotillin-like protein FloA [Vicinamibacteria bacterium]
MGIVALAFLILVGIGFLLYFVPIGLWIAAWSSGASVGIGTLIAMRLRRVPPSLIINPRISAVKAGLNLSVNQLEAHYLSKGNVERVVQALISADKANIALTFERAAAIDLAGRNVLEAVQMSVNPKVITTPKVAAVAKDGIQLIAQSRVTVRADIDRLVGGAGEETVVARVGEGVVSTIGSADTHKHVLENPDIISKTVLKKGLDAGTAFEILSIDIADIDVGANIGAKLQTEQAEADKQIAQAKAEGRRAMAVAQEQEMKARVHEMRAKVVEAEAEVPMAMAQAFREGKLGVMDYYNMQNVVADTKMRDSIARSGEPEDSDERK